MNPPPKCSKFKEKVWYLTLSLPIFWQICSLSAKIISTVKGITSYEVSTFSKLLLLQFFLFITFHKYPKSYFTKLKTHQTQHDFCKWEILHRVREGVQVGDGGSLLWRRQLATLAAKDRSTRIQTSFFEIEIFIFKFRTTFLDNQLWI